VGEHYRLAVCKGPNCSFNGARKVVEALRDALREQGLEDRCTLARGGCYGLCAFGPNVIVRHDDPSVPVNPLAPGDFMLLGVAGESHYSAVNPAQAARIVAEHIGQDQPVQEWLHVNRARGIAVPKTGT
jgi:(2Fe-2S) ferredoxin